MKKVILVISLLLLFNNILFAGDKEDIIKQIKNQWVDFSKKKMDSSLINPNGVWQARSDGGFGIFNLQRKSNHKLKIHLIL